jgi:hypothetical protein
MSDVSGGKKLLPVLHFGTGKSSIKHNYVKVLTKSIPDMSFTSLPQLDASLIIDVVTMITCCTGGFRLRYPV